MSSALKIGVHGAAVVDAVPDRAGVPEVVALHGVLQHPYRLHPSAPGPHLAVVHRDVETVPDVEVLEPPAAVEDSREVAVAEAAGEELQGAQPGHRRDLRGLAAAGNAARPEVVEAVVPQQEALQERARRADAGEAGGDGAPVVVRELELLQQWKLPDHLVQPVRQNSVARDEPETLQHRRPAG